MALNFLVQLLIGIALNIIAYLIMPKPKQEQGADTKDLDDPTAEAGKPVPVVWGTLTLKGLNILWYGEKETVMVKTKKKSSKK